MRRLHLVVAAVSAVVLLAMPAQAELSTNLVKQQVYFTCTASEKVNNLDGAAGWSSTAPTGSYTAGEGCGQADSGLEAGADHDAEFAGTFTGKYDFTVQNIGFVAEEHNVEHTVELVVSASIFDVQANWVYDAAEIASGIVFNPSADQRADVLVKAEVKP